jgi:hypothetical protein
MNDRETSRITALVSAFLLATTACVTENDEVDLAEDHEVDLPVELLAGVELLASVEPYEGVELKFTALPTGGIVVAEKAEVGSVSALSHLLEQGATSLEIYLAVVDSDEAPPAALVDNHAAAVRSGEVADAAPRRFTLPDPDSDFRSHTSQPGVDCSYAADLAWHQGQWQAPSPDWSYHTYWRGALPWRNTVYSPLTHDYHGHMCNDGDEEDGPEFVFWVVRVGDHQGVAVFTDDVSGQERMTVRVEDYATAESYYTGAEVYNCGEGTSWSLGARAP